MALSAEQCRTWFVQQVRDIRNIGRHLSPNSIRSALHRITEPMGLEGFRFHDLRHSYAVSSLQAGDDLKKLQSNLGHHTAAFTMEVYGHCTEEMQQASASRM